MVELTTVAAISDSKGRRPENPLRIVCLIPSATDICVHLGLGDRVVGVTHCCDTEGLPPSVVVVTEDQIHAFSTSQTDIHSRVVENAKKAEEVVGTTIHNKDKDKRKHTRKDEPTTSSLKTEDIPTLYPIHKGLLKEVAPTLIVTQDLCNVCAPSSQTVLMALEEAGIDDARVVLLTPMNLSDVVANMQQVADAAGISTHGRILCESFRSNLEKLESTIAVHHEKRKPATTTSTMPKKVLVMEWVDPPFCGGHWIPDMARLIGTELAIQPTPEGRSRQITWTEIEDSNPDVVIVACCGFDLERNLADARSSSASFRRLQQRSCNNNNYPNHTIHLYAANGDQYFARPSPKLLIGAVIMALCAYNETEEPELVRAIRDLPFASKALDSFEAMKF